MDCIKEQIANKQHEMSTWEEAWTIFVEGEEKHDRQTVQRAVDCMYQIDAGLTNMLVPATYLQMPTTYVAYHGTHEKLNAFTQREVKNYNSIGTYFTSKKEYARRLYGPHVIEATLTLHNPLIVYNVINCPSFDAVFYDEALTSKKQNQVRGDLLLDEEYIKALKAKLQQKGYDGIIFYDSRIDLSSEERTPHTVYVVFNEHQIKLN